MLYSCCSNKTIQSIVPVCDFFEGRFDFVGLRCVNMFVFQTLIWVLRLHFFEVRIWSGKSVEHADACGSRFNERFDLYEAETSCTTSDYRQLHYKLK